MKDLPNQINLAQCKETDRPALGTWSQPRSLATGMRLPAAPDTANCAFGLQLTETRLWRAGWGW